MHVYLIDVQFMLELLHPSNLPPKEIIQRLSKINNSLILFSYQFKVKLIDSKVAHQKEKTWNNTFYL